jgi:S1-C subfamily serine protease
LILDSPGPRAEDDRRGFKVPILSAVKELTNEEALGIGGSFCLVGDHVGRDSEASGQRAPIGRRKARGDSYARYGKVEKTKLDLKYYIQVKGAFDDDGFTLSTVEPGGPATMLTNDDGNVVAALEAGDVIQEVDGKAVKSPKDYAKAMNDAKDRTKIKVKVKDVNSGNSMEFYLSAKEHETKEK